MVDIRSAYYNFCISKNINFRNETSVASYDDTTLFCPAGMQQFKTKFNDKEYKGTIANIQPCIRLNDINEIGDGTHLLYFNMIGLFSFRELTVKDAIDFWMSFLIEINAKPDTITIHPDKFSEWSQYYREYNVDIRLDDDCKWSDGEIGGYCTEFYINNIEIGNIVNPLGDCIDVGFGLERLNLIVNGGDNTDKNSVLKETILKIIDSGFKPFNLKQGYVLRKLLRQLYKNGGDIEHEYFKDEILRQDKIIERYNKLKHRYQDKSKEWWYDTHGVDLDLI